METRGAAVHQRKFSLKIPPPSKMGDENLLEYPPLLKPQNRFEGGVFLAKRYDMEVTVPL